MTVQHRWTHGRLGDQEQRCVEQTRWRGSREGVGERLSGGGEHGTRTTRVCGPRDGCGRCVPVATGEARDQSPASQLGSDLVRDRAGPAEDHDVRRAEAVQLDRHLGRNHAVPDQQHRRVVPRCCGSAAQRIREDLARGDVDRAGAGERRPRDRRGGRVPVGPGEAVHTIDDLVDLTGHRIRHGARATEDDRLHVGRESSPDRGVERVAHQVQRSVAAPSDHGAGQRVRERRA